MPVILFISFCLAIGLYIVQPLADPDIWWHVVSGRWIVANQKFPTVDIWTRFGSEQEWRAYSWSNEIVLALFERWFGTAGLLFLQMTLAVTFTLTLCYCLGKISKNFMLGTLLGGVIVAGSHAHFSLRPQSAVWILFALTIYVAEKITVEGLNRSRLAALAAIFCMWANSHITTVVGLGAVAAWLFPSASFSRKTLTPLLIGSLVAFVATLFTPYFGSEWLILFSKSAHPLLFSSIQEFGPATILQVPTAFLVVLSALAISFWLEAKSAVTIPQLSGALVLILGSLAVVKFLPFALIYLGFVLARQWRQLSVRSIRREAGVADGLLRLQTLIAKIPKEGLSFILLCFAFVNAHNTWQVMVDTDLTPVEAVDLMQRENLPQPILNSFGQGGYLSYRYADSAGNPGVKVSIDGRTNLISPQLWERYQKSWLGHWGWEGHVNEVQPKTILWRGDSPLIRILEAQGRWCTVFRKGEKARPAVVMLERTTVDQLIGTGAKLRCL